MTFLHPWFLLAGAIAAAAAVLALLRPGRQLVVVGSLALWRQTLQSLASTSHPRTRRVTLHWLLLAAGAAAAVLAASQPVYYSAAAGRSVAVAVYPSAELASPAGMESLRQAAGALLDRLDDADRVMLLAPGRSGQWTARSQAKAELAGLSPFPAAAGEIVLPAPAGAQHVYRLAAAGAGVTAGPDETLIQLPTSLPDVTIETVAASCVPRPAGDGTDLLVTLANHSARAFSGQIAVSTWPGEGAWAAAAEVPAGQRRETVMHLPLIECVIVHIKQGGATVAEAFLSRPSVPKVKVAMVGGQEPLVRRLIGVHRGLSLVADANDADVLVCSGAAPPAGKAALVIQPPAPPPGFTPGPSLQDVVLGGRAVAARRSGTDGPQPPWGPLGSPAVHLLPTWSGDGLDSLCVDGQAIMVAGAGPPRRVYVAFSLAAENTNLGLTPEFVQLLARAFAYLALASAGAAEYQYCRPLQLWAGGLQACATRGGEGAAGNPPFAADCPHPWPGLYTDASKQPVAVSLVGLRATAPPTPAAETIASLSLPAPLPLGHGVEFWPYLAAAAMLLWLAGWRLRLR